MNPKSACTVATVEVIREAYIAILCIRAHHPGIPVLVVTDGPGARWMRDQDLHDVQVLEVVFTKPAMVAEHNTYHRSDAIAWKMDAMARCIEFHGDTLLFDADFLLTSPLSGLGPVDADVWLSHNLAESPDAGLTAAKFGMFNAGLVWSRSLKFTAWWKERYLQGSGFYEQGLMNKIPGKFSCGYFDLGHNYGFWRGPADKLFPRSFHVHLDAQRMDAKLTDYMRPKARALRLWAWGTLAGRLPDVHMKARAVLDHPRRVLFAHYGKAGGVYTNLALKHAFRGYRVMDSWADGLGRDWTADEMHALIADAPDFSYAHQHHHGLTRKMIEEAISVGWEVVSFYREPVDLLCSLYFWSQQVFRQRQVNLVLPQEDPEARFTFPEFWQRLMMEDKQHLWRKPEWWDIVPHKGMFAPEAIDKLLVGLVGYTHHPLGLRNASDNPGSKVLRARGTLTEDMLETLRVIDTLEVPLQY